MRSTATAVAVLTALTFSLAGGVAVAESPAAQVENSLDRSTSYVIDAPGIDAGPALLGTVVRLGWCHAQPEGGAVWYESLIQPASVVTAGVTDETRQVRVTVRFSVTTGSLLTDPADFFLLDSDGVRYDATSTDDATGEVAPLITELLLPQDGIVQRSFDVSVPLRSAGLLIGYDPSPADVVVGTWTLSAP